MAIVDFENSTDFQDKYDAAHYFQTTLTGTITSGAQSITLGSASGLPTKGWINIELEQIYYETIAGNVLSNLTRGADGTTAASHDNGTIVEQRINSAAFNNLMCAVKKRRNLAVEATTVGSGAESSQSLTGFASRARIGEFRVVSWSGSQDFTVGLYRKDTFRGEDRLWQSISLNTVQSVTTGTATGTLVPVLDNTNFIIDEVAYISDTIYSGGEYFLIANVSGNELRASDNLSTSYSADAFVTMAHRDQDEFYYEDLDWSNELHVKIDNNDTINNVKIWFDVIAEVSDEP
ncbi:MAG: hypothetical protein ACW98F_00050 [Candidatus Hodarchaeales archaeon]|jgi:hypothetical protein